MSLDILKDGNLQGEAKADIGLPVADYDYDYDYDYYDMMIMILE